MEVKVVVESSQDRKRRFQRQVSIQEDTLDSRDDDELLTGKYGDRFSIKPTSSRHIRPHYQHFHHRQQPHEPYKCSCLMKANRVEVVELGRANCLASYRKPADELYAGLDSQSPKPDQSMNPTLSKAHRFRHARKRQLKAQLDTEFSWTLVVCVLLVRLIIVGPPLNFNLLYVEFRGLFLYHPYTEIIGGLNKISGHLASPALMALVLRYKALRLITFLGCVTCSLSLVFTAFSFEFHQIVLTFSILNGVCGELVQICSTLVVIQHFRQKLWLVEVFSLLSNGLAYSLFSVLIYLVSSWISWRAALRMASGLTYLALVSIVYFRSAPSHRCRTAPILGKKLEKKNDKQLKQLKLLKPSKKPKKARQLQNSRKFKWPAQTGQRADATDGKTRRFEGTLANEGTDSNLTNNLNGGLNAAVRNSANSGDAMANAESSNRNSDARTLSTTMSYLRSASSANADTSIDMPDEDSSDQCKASRSFASFLFRRQSSEQSDRKLEERLERALSNKAIPKRALPIRALCTRRTLLARRTAVTRRTLPVRRSVRPERWSLKRLFDSLKRKQCCLNSLLRRLIRSANLIEYLGLLKSRDLRLIIIFYFLGSLGQIYLAIVEQGQDEHCLADVHRGETNLQATGALRPRLLTNHKLFKSKKMSSNFSSRAHFPDPSSGTRSDANVPSLKSSKSQPPTPSTVGTADRPRAGPSVRLINAINLASLPTLNTDETSILDLVLLNILFGVGYCSSLAATSFLLSRLYLSSKDACKLAILGALLSVLSINALNTCWLRSGLGNWPAAGALDALNDFGCELKSQINSSIDSSERVSSASSSTLWCALVYRVARLSIGLLTPQNVYTAQIALYLLYGFFQAQLEYSTRLLLIERFSQEKLLRVISLHRFMVGLGHLSLLFVRIVVKRLNTNQFVRSAAVCESDDCRTLVSGCIVACSSSIAIVLIRFISNRSVRPARSASAKKAGKVVKKTGWLVGALVRPFKAFRALKLFRKPDRSDVRLFGRPDGSKLSTTNRLLLKKQLSDSDLQALEILRDLVSQRNSVNLCESFEKPVAYGRSALRRTKSEQQLTETTDYLSNYLVDCVLCGRCFVVDIDLSKASLVEICLLDDLKVSLILRNG